MAVVNALVIVLLELEKRRISIWRVAQEPRRWLKSVE
jgi:hypothetical protein